MKTCFQTYDRMGTLTYLKAIRKLGDFCVFNLEMPGSDQHMLCCLSFFLLQVPKLMTVRNYGF